MRLKPDPLGVPRDPLAVFLLVLALISGLGFIFDEPSSGSLERSLPHWGQITWGVMLTFGATLSLAGMFWPWQQRDGLLVKRVGMAALAISAMVYAVAIWIQFGWTAALPGALAFFFGYACFLRYRIINRAIHVLMLTKALNGKDEEG